MESSRSKILESENLPDKPFLSEGALLEIWKTRGMQYAVEDFFLFCQDRGLMPHYRVDHFCSHFYQILQFFLVNGISKVDPEHVTVKKPKKWV